MFVRSVGKVNCRCWGGLIDAIQVFREITDYDDYEGRIDAVETVDVRARVRGYLVKVAFEDGQIVKPGALLYEVDPRPYKATLDAAKALQTAAEASLELAKKTFIRTDRLARTGAASREERDVDFAKQAVASAEVLKAEAAVEQAQLDLRFTKVFAPTNGRLSRTQATVGNLVKAGETLLTTLTSVDPMYVYFDVDERSLLRYRKEFGGGPAENGSRPLSIKDLKMPVELGLEGEEGYPHHGVIDFSDNRVNPSTGTIRCRGVLANPSRILDAGLRARVRIPVGSRHKAVMVTERAVGNDQGQKFVYVVNEHNIVERRDVTLARVVDGLQVVKSGLKPDEWIIVNGIQRARDGMKVEPTRSLMPGAAALPQAQSAPAKGSIKG